MPDKSSNNPGVVLATRSGQSQSSREAHREMGGHNAVKSETDQWPTLAEEDQEDHEMGKEFQGSR